jgi:hypothetical protein
MVEPTAKTIYRRQSDLLIPVGLVATVIGIFVSVQSIIAPLIAGQVKIAERLTTIETKLERVNILERRLEGQSEQCNSK